MGDVRRTRAYRKLVAELRSLHIPRCAICGRRIDYDARPKSRWSFSADHIIPYSHRPDLGLEFSNLRPTHYGCNSGRGNRTGAEQPRPQTRRW